MQTFIRSDLNLEVNLVNSGAETIDGALKLAKDTREEKKLFP